MKRTLFSIAAILCASLVFFSCSKDDNSTVVDAQALTSFIDVQNANWGVTKDGNGNPDGLGYIASWNTDEITQEITDNGAVWIYYSFDDGNSYELAPSLSRSDENGNIFDFLAESGTNNGGYVTLTALKYTGNTNQAPKYTDPRLLVKIVSIPSSLYQAHKNVNKEDYNEVKRVFNLK